MVVKPEQLLNAYSPIYDIVPGNETDANFVQSENVDSLMELMDVGRLTSVMPEPWKASLPI